MKESEIKAGDVPLKKLFGEEHLFEIPGYQRPFSWQEDNFEDLIDDLWSALQRNKETYGESEGELDEYEPYFLGSIILQGSNGRYNIIDGQQRLISLSILFAVLRDLLEEETDKLQKFIFQEADEIRGTSAVVRLEFRNKEKNFFETRILKEGGTANLDDIGSGGLSEPKENILEALKVFKSYLKDKGSEELREFAAFLAQKVVMVEIKTISLSSAFKLFNITNARGMALTNADLLKSVNLGKIEEGGNGGDVDDYTQKWEDIEGEIGGEGLDKLISFIRHIKLKTKAQKSIYDEYMEKVFDEEPDFQGKEFIDYLENIEDIYKRKILDGEINPDVDREGVYYFNLVSVMKSFLPSDDWMAVLIRFVDKYRGESYLHDFLKKLERKITVDWISGLTTTQRLTELYRVIREIEESEAPEEVLDSEILNGELDSKREDFGETLDLENFYRKGNYRMAKYVLLRLDLERFDNTDRKTLYGEKVTVEHILPQTPTHDYWLSRFNREMFRRKWTDKLGNLVLLNGRKNSSARNFPYPKKVEEYFVNRSDFVITNDLGDKYEHWTPDHLRERHGNLRREALGLWFGSE